MPREEVAPEPVPEEKSEEPVEAIAPPPKKADNMAGGGRTMLGMPAPQAAQIEAALERAREKVAEGSGPGPSKAKAIEVASNRTMLGQPAPKRRGEPASPEPSSPAPTRRSDRPRAAVVYPQDTGEEEALTLPTRGPGRGLAVVALGLGGAILVAGVAAMLYSFFSGGVALHARVLQGETGEMLEIEVPEAAEGTRVRFGGDEQELEAGRARFALSADDLSIGDNELSVSVVSPDGSVEAHAVELHLEMRVRADLGPLSAAPPAIEVIVEAAPGSEVTLDGDALALDEHGRATRRYEIDGADASAEGIVESVVRYRIHPPEGDEAQGELRTRIPVTTMQLDRPGADVVTEAEEIEFAGAVAPETTVTVGGEPVEVRMGRFLHTHPLPAVGEHTIEVVAQLAGRAPRVERVRVRRVESLEAEAASFEFDRSLTYARIQSNPTTFRGQHVRFEGLVYNVDVRDGQSVLQVLVRDCPRGERCPLWVSYPAATAIELRANVRVLGTVAGEQQFRSQSGQVRTVPRVDATYVLPVQRRR